MAFSRHKGAAGMKKPIPDRAEVALEYPDKLYIGTFERSSRFEAHLDAKGIALTLERTGDSDVQKSLHMHLNYELFAEILRDLAATVTAVPDDDEVHRSSLAEAAETLHDALARPKRKAAKKARVS
jgi:hypothetical protein